MGVDDIKTLDDLNELYWQNRSQLGKEEQRLFQGILLELQKGECCDKTVLSTLLRQLGERRNLY